MFDAVDAEGVYTGQDLKTNAPVSVKHIPGGLEFKTLSTSHRVDTTFMQEVTLTSDKEAVLQATIQGHRSVGTF